MAGNKNNTSFYYSGGSSNGNAMLILSLSSYGIGTHIVHISRPRLQTLF